MFKYLPLAFQIVSALMAAETQFVATGTVSVPQIRTYIEGQHVSVDISVAKIA